WHISVGKISLPVFFFFYYPVAPKISLKPPLVVVDQQNSLECRAEGFYPGVVSIEWLRDSQPLSSQSPVQIQNNPDGSFTASNSYTFIPTVSEIGGKDMVATCFIIVLGAHVCVCVYKNILLHMQKKKFSMKYW
uniref:Ig-like domain-containing protein n=1 Tax=Erpetoichthys calabaricus TaxID=27687 RepID=A0A8C4SMF6_ERPCA